MPASRHSAPTGAKLASVHLYPNVDPCDHLQEDVVEGVYNVILYRHPAARCDSCRNWVKKAGDGELLGSRIEPQLRSKAVYLRNGIGISYRKVPKPVLRWHFGNRLLLRLY